MIAAILAAAALAAPAAVPTAPVTECHLDAQGNANHCDTYNVTTHGIYTELSGRASLCWCNPDDGYLADARVNGRAGRWNFDHTLKVWARLHVTFDGISFVNYSTRTVRVAAHSE